MYSTVLISFCLTHRCDSGFIGARCEYLDLGWLVGGQREIVIISIISGLVILLLIIVFICVCAQWVHTQQRFLDNIIFFFSLIPCCAMFTVCFMLWSDIWSWDLGQKGWHKTAEIMPQNLYWFAALFNFYHQFFNIHIFILRFTYIFVTHAYIYICIKLHFSSLRWP